MAFKTRILFSYFFWFAFQLHAQFDTINIPEITIIESYKKNENQNIQRFDSLELRKNYGLSFDQLVRNAAFQLRSYGPGQLNTLSIRGANSNQTGIYWNDFQVNNLMLGTSDLTLFSISENKDILINASGNDFGAPGGSVYIKNHLSIKRNRNFLFSVNSLNNYLSAFETSDYIGTIPINASFSIQKNNNDFSYIIDDIKRKNTNAESSVIDASFNTEFRIKTIISKFFFSYVGSERKIPPSKYENESIAMQDDKSLKLGAHFMDSIGLIQIQLKAALLFDELNYINPKISEFSESTIYSGCGIIETNYNFSKKFQTSFTINNNYNTITSSVYKVEGENIMKFSGKTNIYFKRLNIIFNMNSGIYSKELLPVNPSIDLLYGNSKKMILELKAGKNLRLPSYNDRFWNKNTDDFILPEESVFIELNIKNSNKRIFKNSISLYHKNIKNSIVWLPENGIWKADNIKRAVSYGIDLHTESMVSVGKWLIQWKNAYKYNHSQLEDENYGNKSGKALYNPGHIMVSSVRLLRNFFYADISAKYNSRVFTVFDGSDFIDPVIITDIFAGFSTQILRSKFQFDISVLNFFGADYESIKNYAMPGRVISLKVSFIINKEKI